MYIGQTINEKDRRKHFLIQKLSYGGIKIDTARAKYNPENFKYEILETRFYMTKKAAAKELDILESYYIGLYDSYKYGYNMTLGGGTTTGLKFTEEQKEKCRKRMLEHNPFKVETGLLGQLEIGAGKIKMDIPIVNKSLVLNQQDLNELKDMSRIRNQKIERNGIFLYHSFLFYNT